ncbi:SirB2 family protein [Salinisphaera sp. LB1]|uniref:SirB2 family protein n=1 Tax=Salinisphaera sp. LB1 TaxID=2183911 RepID=UPI000D706450|nr:SirB2 family protein [Salinisphaera sp. LB1]AWN15745.1 Protein SirB2 [Salinisphaera sp. LB1]
MIDAYYDAIKTVHVTCVALSGSLFASRALWVLLSKRALWRWLRVLPHLIDTLLLASGLTLAFLIHQYPFLNSDWLTAKVIGLIVYIALGVAVFRGRQTGTRAVTGLMALIVFAYIVSVAFSKQPAGFLAPYL